MKTHLKMDAIAKHLGGERKGKVSATSGYFGATQLLADVEVRLRAPARGGRRTDPNWTERRLLPLAPETLARLEELSEKLCTDRGIRIEPMQLAALILEKTAEHVSAEDTEEILRRSSIGTAGRRTKRG